MDYYRDDPDKLALVILAATPAKPPRRYKRYLWLLLIALGLAVGFGVPALMLALGVEGW